MLSVLLGAVTVQYSVLAMAMSIGDALCLDKSKVLHESELLLDINQGSQDLCFSLWIPTRAHRICVSVSVHFC